MLGHTPYEHPNEHRMQLTFTSSRRLTLQRHFETLPSFELLKAVFAMRFFGAVIT